MCSSDIWLSSNARSSFESGFVTQLLPPATDAMAIHEFGGNHSRSGTPSLRMRRRPVCAQYSAHISVSANCAVTRRLRIRSMGPSSEVRCCPNRRLTRPSATQGTTEQPVIGPSITQYFVRSIRATCLQSSGRRDRKALAHGGYRPLFFLFLRIVTSHDAATDGAY